MSGDIIPIWVLILRTPLMDFGGSTVLQARDFSAGDNVLPADSQGMFGPV